MDYKKVLVAHRGDHFMAPENSIRAFQIALDSAAQFFEFDVQLSQDAVAFVGHDVNLIRTVRKNIDMFKTPAIGLKDLLPDLKSVVDLFNQSPDSTVFVEIKRQSVDQFSAKVCLDAVVKELRTAKFQVVIISYKKKVVRLAREAGLKVGWVNDNFDFNTIETANALHVDYLFSKASNVLQNHDFKKNWQLAVYTINDPEQVEELLEHGVDLIETDHFLKLYKILNNVL